MWREETIIITTEKGETKSIHGWRDRENAPLAVTPEWNAEKPLSTNCVITHVRTGLTLWPNAWPLELAQRICAALLELDGWSTPNPMANRALKARAERIAKTLGFAAPVSAPEAARDRVFGRFSQ